MEITIKTTKKQELIDITSKVESLINIEKGICHLFTPHATAALMIQENADPNICDDILTTLNKIIPLHNNYKHDKIDNNAAAHIKAGIIGPSEIIPVKDGKLQLGTWQNIFLVELDGPRTRKLIIKIISD